MSEDQGRNRYQCLTCFAVMESTFQHDFKHCPCGNLFVDGGDAYHRCGFRDGPDSYVFIGDDDEKIDTPSSGRQVKTLIKAIRKLDGELSVLHNKYIDLRLEAREDDEKKSSD